jgi:hypothetical protein
MARTKERFGDEVNDLWDAPSCVVLVDYVYLYCMSYASSLGLSVFLPDAMIPKLGLYQYLLKTNKQTRRGQRPDE